MTDQVTLRETKHKNGNLKSQGYFKTKIHVNSGGLKIEEEVEHGEYKEWDENRVLIEHKFYKDGDPLEIPEDEEKPIAESYRTFISMQNGIPLLP